MGSFQNGPHYLPGRPRLSSLSPQVSREGEMPTYCHQQIGQAAGVPGAEAVALRARLETRRALSDTTSVKPWQFIRLGLSDEARAGSKRIPTGLY